MECFSPEFLFRFYSRCRFQKPLELTQLKSAQNIYRAHKTLFIFEWEINTCLNATFITRDLIRTIVSLNSPADNERDLSNGEKL